jgi:hypothetical protein
MYMNCWYCKNCWCTNSCRCCCCMSCCAAVGCCCCSLLLVSLPLLLLLLLMPPAAAFADTGNVGGAACCRCCACNKCDCGSMCGANTAAACTQYTTTPTYTIPAISVTDRMRCIAQRVLRICDESAQRCTYCDVKTQWKRGGYALLLNTTALQHMRKQNNMILANASDSESNCLPA